MELTPVEIFYALYAFNLLTFIWDFYLAYRQYRVHYKTDKRPKHVEQIISEEEYDKARLYKLDKHRFGFVKAIFGQVETSLILWTNFVAIMWYKSGDITAQYYGENEMIQSILFCFIQSIMSAVIGLPFAYYEHFVIEEKFGFNKQTVGFFFKDSLKKLIISLLLSAPIICGIIWIIRVGGPYFFVYVWIFISFITFMLMWIYPEFIAPLFDKYTPLPESELKTKIEALANRVSFPLTKLFVVEGSKRSSHSNAYMYGFWKNKRIVLYDTLLSPEMNERLKKLNDPPTTDKKTDEVIEGKKDPAEESEEKKEGQEETPKEKTKSLGMSDDEVVAVLGHELGHWKLMHTLSNLVIVEVNMLLVLVVFSYFYKNPAVYEAFGFKSQPILIGLFLVMQYILAPYNELVSLAMSFLSRYFEFSADRFSAELGYASLLVSGLVKLGKDNLSLPVDDWLYSMVNHSHPPTPERIQALKKYL